MILILFVDFVFVFFIVEDFIYSIIVARLTHLREVEENREKETIGTQSIRQEKKINDE